MFPNIFREFPKISKGVRRFPKTAEDFRGRSEYVWMKHQRFYKPANNFCLWAGHLSGQKPVLTGQEASLVGQKCKSV